MKLVFAMLILSTVSASGVAAEINCRSSSVTYRKAATTYNNTIALQWACAAAKNVPFSQRGSNPVVKDCMKTAKFYLQVQPTSQEVCERLDMPNGAQHFLLNVLDSTGIWIPKLQGTVFLE